MGYKKFGKLVDRLDKSVESSEEVQELLLEIRKEYAEQYRLARIYRKTLQKAAKYIAKHDAVISSLEKNVFDVDMFNEIEPGE
nr:hypothetical protein [uncultured Butyrivibrio sp.]